MKSSWIRSSGAVVVALGCAAAVPSIAAASHANTPVDRVYVVQGVPGTAVNVAVDGKTVRHAVAAKAVVGPLRLTPGKHTVSFSTNGWKVTSGVTISHRSSDVVLHWPADPTNKPVVTVFGNDLAPVSSNKGRLTVVHAAVVPPADIRVDNKVLFANIANGQYVSAEVPGGTYSVDVVPTGQTTHPLLGPVMLPVKTGVLTRVFAIGKPTNGSMDAIVQVLPLASDGSSAPGTVDASSSDPIDVLAVSKPEPAGRHASDAGASPSGASARHVKPTPAQVGQPGPLQVDSERPRTLVLPSGTRMRVRPSATSPSGALTIPADIKQAGWWDGSSKLGDPFGAIVVAAHVDSFTQGLGRFAELLSMKPGDVVRLSSAGRTETFSVASAGLVPKSSISATSGVFSADGPSRLVLITCGGVFDPSHGGYQSNMVVVAYPRSRISRRH